MDIKNTLTTIRLFDEIVGAKRREVNRLKTQYTKTDGDTKSDIARQFQSIEVEIRELFLERERWLRRINSLNDPVEKMVLQWIYVDGYDQAFVSAKLNASAKTVYNIKKRAIRSLTDTIQK